MAGRVDTCRPFPATLCGQDPAGLGSVNDKKFLRDPLDALVDGNHGRSIQALHDFVRDPARFRRQRSHHAGFGQARGKPQGTHTLVGGEKPLKCWPRPPLSELRHRKAALELRIRLKFPNDGRCPGTDDVDLAGSREGLDCVQ